MANQIGKFFVSEDGPTAAAGIADHIGKFWDPRMRAEIIAHARDHASDLDPTVREAILSLPPPASR